MEPGDPTRCIFGDLGAPPLLELLDCEGASIADGASIGLEYESSIGFYSLPLIMRVENVEGCTVDAETRLIDAKTGTLWASNRTHLRDLEARADESLEVRFGCEPLFYADGPTFNICPGSPEVLDSDHVVLRGAFRASESEEVQSDVAIGSIRCPSEPESDRARCDAMCSDE